MTERKQRQIVLINIVVCSFGTYLTITHTCRSPNTLHHISIHLPFLQYTHTSRFVGLLPFTQSVCLLTWRYMLTILAQTVHLTPSSSFDFVLALARFAIDKIKTNPVIFKLVLCVPRARCDFFHVHIWIRWMLTVNRRKKSATNNFFFFGYEISSKIGKFQW